MVTIERVGIDRWQDVRSVRVLAIADAPFAFGSTVEREQTMTEDEWARRFDNSGWYLAQNDGQFVGVAAAFQHDSAPAPELVSMWIAPSMRGTTLAADLVGKIVEWTRCQGFAVLNAGVVSDNYRAIRFYERVGFVPTGDMKPLITDPSKTVVYLSMAIETAGRMFS